MSVYRGGLKQSAGGPLGEAGSSWDATAECPGGGEGGEVVNAGNGMVDTARQGEERTRAMSSQLYKTAEPEERGYIRKRGHEIWLHPGGVSRGKGRAMRRESRMGSKGTSIGAIYCE